MSGADLGRRAVFVDRDGTVIVERGYLSDPAGVELESGAVDGLRSLHEAGYAIVLVANQSGIARGYFTEDDYRAVDRAVREGLAVADVPVLASYHCPHHPSVSGPCACRKPAPGLFERAAAEHGLGFAGSIFIGDRLRDVEPARELGGRPILVRTGYGSTEAGAAPAWVEVAADLGAAARLVLEGR